ncbi:hypothetical protein BH23PAT1_BH23PAT1_2980 [soil metagenome]
MMTLADLQTYYNPGPGNRVLKRTLHNTKKKALKLIKASLRKAKSKVRAIVRRQYFVTCAYSDLQVAVRRNEDIFLGTLMITLGVSFSFAVTAVEALLLFFRTAFELSGSIGLDVGLLTIVALAILAVLGVWVSAFLTNLQSIAFIQGATGNNYRSLRSTIRKSLRYSSRISAVWFMLCSLIFTPLVIGVALGYLYLSINPLSMSQIFNLLQAAIVLAIIWVIIVIMNFGLTPYAALYEPGLNLRQAFVRSARLVQRRGRIFILFVYCLIGLALFAAYEVSELANTTLGTNSWLIFSALALAILALGNGIMAMLYRKRKLARKY